MFPQFSGGNTFSRLAHYVGYQPSVSRPKFPNNHDPLFHGFGLCQHCLDFPQFNPKTTDFDLIVYTVEILKVTVRMVPSQVSCFIEPGVPVVTEQLRHKLLFRQIRSIQIASGYPCSPYVQLARNTHWHWLHMAIQNIDRCIGNGPADQDLPVRIRQLITGGPNSSLRRPVHIPDTPSTLNEFTCQIPGESLSTAKNLQFFRAFPAGCKQ